MWNLTKLERVTVPTVPCNPSPSRKTMAANARKRPCPASDVPFPVAKYGRAAVRKTWHPAHNNIHNACLLILLSDLDCVQNAKDMDDKTVKWLAKARSRCPAFNDCRNVKVVAESVKASPMVPLNTPNRPKPLAAVIDTVGTVDTVDPLEAPRAVESRGEKQRNNVPKTM